MSFPPIRFIFISLLCPRFYQQVIDGISRFFPRSFFGRSSVSDCAEEKLSFQFYYWFWNRSDMCVFPISAGFYFSLTEKKDISFWRARVKKWNEIPQFTIIWRLIIKLALISPPLASRAPKMNLRETFFRPFFLAPAKGESENMCTHIRPDILVDEEQQDMGKSQELHDSRGAIRTGSNQQ